ncbi:GNAT family N-acetyltransferase [Labedella phragmitis]|uniref:GNAT family N-acetyltransferase n=1 Tax=Labedella phragmitis TaxID=2498849 RepID=A0A444PZH2_9MICO|nr:GNAT family N-acetyltransferase [Labedella phragmitis]RWZ53203.1 GNAT family N-acetyltransferase [Labedella phragmitis]
MSPRARAERAADRAGVSVEEALTPAGALATERVFSATWGEGRGADASTLQALAHAGNPVLIARRGDAVLGALFSFLGWHGGLHVHSHMTAVDPHTRSTGVGFALKLAQRALCLDNGVREVRWTYDPLIRRNARFNLWKLGADVSAFRPDFYGVLDDAINGSDRSDRFEVSWRLDAPEVELALDGVPRDVDDREDDVALPADFEALRGDDPAAAARLRESSRESFAEALDAGSSVKFTGTGYIFDRPTATRERERR